MASPTWTQLALNAFLLPAGITGTDDPTLVAPGVLSGPGNPFLVAALGTPGMSVTINSGVAVIAGAAPSTAGSAMWSPGQTLTKSVLASDPTNPRIDVVTIQITDPGSDITASLADVVIVPGTPAVSPVLPAVPAGSVILATIAVGAAVTSITNSNITMVRTYTGFRDFYPEAGWDMSGVPSTSAKTIPYGAWTPYPANVINEQIRVGTITANPAAVTISVPGRYQLAMGTGYVQTTDDVYPQCEIRITRGATLVRRIAAGGSLEQNNAPSQRSAAGLVRLQIGDVITAHTYQRRDSTGTLDLDITSVAIYFSGSRISA